MTAYEVSISDGSSDVCSSDLEESDTPGWVGRGDTRQPQPAIFFNIVHVLHVQVDALQRVVLLARFALGVLAPIHNARDLLQYAMYLIVIIEQKEIQNQDYGHVTLSSQPSGQVPSPDSLFPTP